MKLTKSIDKFGTAGLFLTALFSPCCFPLFAFAASALGLGSFELFGGWTMWVFQAMVLISVAGLYLSYRRHRCTYPLLVAIPSGLFVFYGYNFNNSDYWHVPSRATTSSSSEGGIFHRFTSFPITM